MNTKKSLPLALAADIGGTRMRAALIDTNGRVAQRRAQDTNGIHGPEQAMERLADDLKGLASSASPQSIVGLGLAVASSFDTTRGVMFSPPNLPAWHNFAPGAYLKRKLGYKTFARNDANLAVLGELRFGAGRGLRHLVYLTISTGVGGGIIIDGKMYEGYRGMGAELGHMTIEKDGPLCGCGNRGCLEALASGTAIARTAREGLASGKSSSLLALAGGDINKVDARVVGQAARAGDAFAREIMRDASYNIGVTIAGLLNFFDPEMVILGGGVSNDLDMMMPFIMEAVRTRTMAHNREPVPIVRSRLGDDAGLVGAAALAFDLLQA